MADHSYQIGERAQGRYEILALLPPHTLGVLYRAVDRDPGSAGQERLLCVIGRALLPSDDARAGFVRKVGLARGLRLPQLMSLHDVVVTQGPDGAQVLLVAEWAGLDRLRDRLEQRRMERSRWPLPATEAWSALSEVALAMGALHKAAEVLGDLRAENVFITPTGVKLLQHGEGLAVQRAALVELLERRGEDHALSPEVRQGSAPTMRSDVYSLGALAWELFFGVSPQLSQGSPPVGALERPGLRAALERAMSVNPLDRPNNVDGFLRSVEPTLSEPLSPLPAGFTAPSGDLTPAVAAPTPSDWQPKEQVTREIEVDNLRDLLGTEEKGGGPTGANATRQIDVDEIEALLKKSRDDAPADAPAATAPPPSAPSKQHEMTTTMSAPQLEEVLKAKAAGFASESTVVNPKAAANAWAGAGAPPLWEDVQAKAAKKRGSPTLLLLFIVALLAGIGYLVWSVGTGRLGARGIATPSASPGMPAPFVPTSGADSPANLQPPATAPSGGPAVVAVVAKTTCPSGMTLTHAVCVDPTAQEVPAGATKGVSFVEAARFCGARGGRLCRESEWQAACADGKWSVPRGEWAVDADESPVLRGAKNCAARAVPKSMAGSPQVTFRCCGDPR